MNKADSATSNTSMTTPEEQSGSLWAYGSWLSRFGWLLLAASFLGFWALGPTSQSSIFGQWWYFDMGQNLIHLTLGLLSLAVAYWPNPKLQQISIGVLSFIFLVAATLGIFSQNILSPNAWVVNIEFPLETIFYLALGLVSAWIALMPAGPIFVDPDNQP